MPVGAMSLIPACWGAISHSSCLVSKPAKPPHPPTQFQGLPLTLCRALSCPARGRAVLLSLGLVLPMNSGPLAPRRLHAPS